MLVLKLQTRASQVFLSIVCTVQKPSYLKGRPSCCDNWISIWIAKASSCPPVYVGWQLHVSYIPGLTVDPLHFVLHRKCQKLLTGIWLVAVCKYFLPELWAQNCLGEDSHFMPNWSLSSSFPFSLYLSVLPHMKYGSCSGSNLICCVHAFTLVNLANLSLSLTFCWHVCNPSLNSNLLSFTIAWPAFLTEQSLQIHEHGHCHHLLSQKQHFQAIY